MLPVRASRLLRGPTRPACALCAASRRLSHAAHAKPGPSRRHVIHGLSELPPAPSDPRRVVDPRSGFTFTDRGPLVGVKRTAPIIVCLHGCPGSTFEWRWLGPGLEVHTRVIRLDLPGHGATPASATRSANPADVGEAAWGAVESILAGRGESWGGASISEADDAASASAAVGPVPPPRKVVLLAHSLGTELAVVMAAQRPERVAGLVLLAPVGVRPHKGARPWWIVTAFSRLCADPRFRSLTRPLVRLVYTRLLGFPGRHSTDEFFWCQARIGSRDFGRFRDAAACLGPARHGIPALLAWAEDDPLIEPAIAEELAEVLRGGSGSSSEGLGQGMEEGPVCCVFSRGGHNINKTHASALSARVLEWLQPEGCRGAAAVADPAAAAAAGPIAGR